MLPTVENVRLILELTFGIPIAESDAAIVLQRLEEETKKVEPHYFMTPPDVHFPDNRFCAKCGAYFTHPNHLHGRDCQCKACKTK